VRTILRVPLAAAAASLLSLGMMSAAQATPVRADGPPMIPADCTLNTTGHTSASLTCTQRPANQQWNLTVECLPWLPKFMAGNIVTGDGTSTVQCGAGVLIVGEWFTID
jgi:hypothetical protein